MPGSTAGDQRRIARKARIVVASACLGLVFVACTVEKLIVIEVSTVEVSPSPVRTVTGQETQMHAVVLNDRGEALDDAVVSWGTTEPSVASVSTTGLLVAHNPGWIEVNATYAGTSGSATVVVTSR